MGLDQYLYAKRYLSPVGSAPENKELFYKVIESVEASSFISDQFPSVYVEVKVAYWRKANQIHDWFVNKVQDGEDNCAEYYVERDDLQELIKLCDHVIAHPEDAEDYLPTSSGFFFGSTEYGEYYMNDIKYTSDTLKSLLANVPEDWSFFYASSW